MGKVLATPRGRGKAKMNMVLTPKSYEAPRQRRTPGLRTTPKKGGATK
jgi:hypothetical protein